MSASVFPCDECGRNIMSYPCEYCEREAEEQDQDWQDAIETQAIIGKVK